MVGGSICAAGKPIPEIPCHYEILSGCRKQHNKHHEVTNTSGSVTKAFAARNLNSIVTISNCSTVPKMFSLEPCKHVVVRKWMETRFLRWFFFSLLIETWSWNLAPGCLEPSEFDKKKHPGLRSANHLLVVGQDSVSFQIGQNSASETQHHYESQSKQECQIQTCGCFYFFSCFYLWTCPKLEHSFLWRESLEILSPR